VRLAASGRLRADHRAPRIESCAWLWRAFLELLSCRQLGAEQCGPIPITAVWQYIDRYGLPEWTVDALFSIEMTWRETERERQERAAAAAPKPPGLPAPPRRQVRPWEAPADA
jgi:hypothetical protein